MKIGIIGAGWLGGTVAERWVQRGHEVMFSSRHPEKYFNVARRIGPTASAGTTRQAATFGDAILIAVPFNALAQVGGELGDVLAGKLVIDATNPPPRDDAYGIGAALASAERLPGTRLVRGFSSVDATEIEASGLGRRPRVLAVPLASNDRAAMEVAAQLMRDAGCAPVIVGALADAEGFQRGGPAFACTWTNANCAACWASDRQPGERPRTSVAPSDSDQSTERRHAIELSSTSPPCAPYPHHTSRQHHRHQGEKPKMQREAYWRL